MKAKKPHKKRRKRVGHGPSSGHGKTSCRGHKGQMSRSGSSRTPGFEGGQMPFIRRLPKRGFNRPFKKRYQIVNLNVLNRLQEAEVTADLLLKKGVIHDIQDGLKILGDGALSRPVTVRAHRFSQQAKTKIEQAGGKAVVVAAE